MPSLLSCKNYDRTVAKVGPLYKLPTIGLFFLKQCLEGGYGNSTGE